MALALSDDPRRGGGRQVHVAPGSGGPLRLESHARNEETPDITLAKILAHLEQKRGFAVAKARGKKLGRQPGQRPKSDRLAPKVLVLVAQGQSYRLIAREVGLSKNTVAAIVKRSRSSPDRSSEGPISPVRAA